jgi:hypothetical protein
MVSGEPRSKLKGVGRHLWNIFYATSLNIIGIFKCHLDSLCDIEKYSLLRLGIFFHVDKGLM